MDRQRQTDATRQIRFHRRKETFVQTTTHRNQGLRLGVFRAVSLLTLALMLAGGIGLFTALAADAATLRRVVSVSASMSIKDDEWISDEYCSATKTGSFTLTSTYPLREFHMIKKCGGEVRAELHLSRVQLLSSGRIYVSGEARLYEGTSGNTTDLEHRRTFSFYVSTNGSYTKTVKVENFEWNSDDYAVIKFTVVNRKA
jgi:hypothetical protein